MIEVRRMHDDPIWRAFAETGDPVYYLLYRAAQSAPQIVSAAAEG